MHKNALTRRQTLAAGAAITASSALSACGRAKTDYGAAPDWMMLLCTNEQGGRDYEPQFEGVIPADLNGALYRNGPGRFERAGHRKKHLLDGDGLVQRLTLSNGRVRYQNRFVETAKYKEEEAAGKPLHSTWATLRPGAPFRSIGGGAVLSQAGVTVYEIGGKIYAFDELNPGHELDSESLALKRTHVMAGGGAIKAHVKADLASREYLFAGTNYGREITVFAGVHDERGELKVRHEFISPRPVYIHDFFATENYFIFLLHPVAFSPLGFLAGARSFVDSLSWRPEEGNLIAVLPKSGGKPKFFEASAAFMWHSLNAYEEDGDIIADFIGYHEPDHFIGQNALFYEIMKGRMGRAAAAGEIRRYIIDLAKGSLYEFVIDEGNHEFPMVDPRVALRKHRVGYYTAGGIGVMNTGLKRLDYETGNTQKFDFGLTSIVGEPVFAAKPGGANDQGWLITQVLDGESNRTFFAVFDAEAVDAGPIAKIHLRHHVPISFHGCWKAA